MSDQIIENIVTFESPPLEEVAIAVQFEDVSLGLRRLMSVYDLFKDDYPNVDQKAPIGPSFEIFEGLPAPIPEFGVQFIQEPPSQRYWFASEGGQNLIQVQSDRFVLNWRKRGDEPYPRAENIIPAFMDRLSKFVSCLDAEKQDVVVNQVEISYFNTIAVGDAGKYSDTAADYFLIAPRRTLNIGSVSNIEEEFSRVSIKYIFRDNTGRARGRVHLDLMPALDADGKKVIRLQLIARGRPSEGSESGIQDFIISARNHIVKIFDSIVTERGAKEWGRTYHG